MCLEVDGSGVDWAFFKADREAPYKNIPLSPAQTSSCIVELRFPSGGKWYGFGPPSMTLLFGAAAAAPRRATIVFQESCKFGRQNFRSPLVNYFGDFGWLISDSSRNPAVKVFAAFCKLENCWVFGQNGRKRIWADGLLRFPGSDNGMSMSIGHTAAKKQKLDKRISEFIEAGAISHQ